MTPERAQEIISAVNDRCMFTMEVSEKLRSLDGVSLAEMMEAKSIVEAENHAAESVNGSRTIKLIPDDRLIAAAYCMEHYPVSNEEAILIMPMRGSEGFWHETNRKALVIVPLKQSSANEDDDEEEAA